MTTQFQPTTTQSAFVLCLLVSACSFNTNNQLASDADTVGADASALADAAVTDGGVADPDSAMATPDAAPQPDGALQPPPVCDATDSDLVLCLTFDGLATDPSTIPDGSGNTNVVTISNAGIAAGQDGDALQTDEGFTSSINASTDLDAAKTIEMWIKPNRLDRNFQGLFEGNDYWFYLNANGVLSCDFRTSTQTAAYTLNAVVANGVWQHVACVMDAGQTKIFVDGVEIQERTNSVVDFPNLNPNRYSFGRGSMWWGGVRFVGSVDTVRIWKTDRSGQLCPECSQPPIQ